TMDNTPATNGGITGTSTTNGKNEGLPMDTTTTTVATTTHVLTYAQMQMTVDGLTRYTISQAEARAELDAAKDVQQRMSRKCLLLEATTNALLLNNRTLANSMDIERANNERLSGLVSTMFSQLATLEGRHRASIRIQALRAEVDATCNGNGAANNDDLQQELYCVVCFGRGADVKTLFKCMADNGCGVVIGRYKCVSGVATGAVSKSCPLCRVNWVPLTSPRCNGRDVILPPSRRQIFFSSSLTIHTDTMYITRDSIPISTVVPYKP
ncbi:hypothetical protein PENTCL1PPCAC_11487, partial [Pristionchus entomophagus]